MPKSDTITFTLEAGMYVEEADLETIAELIQSVQKPKPKETANGCQFGNWKVPKKVRVTRFDYPIGPDLDV